MNDCWQGKCKKYLIELKWSFISILTKDISPSQNLTKLGCVSSFATEISNDSDFLFCLCLYNLLWGKAIKNSGTACDRVTHILLLG